MSVKLTAKLSILFLAMTFLSMLLISVLGYRAAVNALKLEIFHDLKLVAEGKEAEILEYLESKRVRAIDFASNRFLAQEVERILALQNKDARKKATRTLNAYLRDIKKPIDADIREVRVLDLNGSIIASSDESRVGSENDADQPFFVHGKDKAFIQPPSLHERNGERLLILPIATPIRSARNNAVIGVLMNAYTVQTIQSILTGTRNRKLGNITEVENDTALEIQLINNRGQLVASTQTLAVTNGSREIRTDPVARCLNSSEELNAEWVDYKGRAVWGASSCIHVEKDWKSVLVVKKEKDSALVPIIRLRNNSILFGGAVLFLAALVSLLAARRVTKPIEDLHRGTEIIGSGNLDYKLATNAKDEIGQLSRAFDRMTENLKAVTASRDDLNREIEERIQAEESLRQSEERYRKLFETTKDGLFLLKSGEMRIINSNPAATDILGYDKNELNGKRLQEVGVFTDEEEYSRAVQDMHHHGYSRVENVLVAKKNGDTILADIMIVNRTDVVQCNIRDFTERRKTEELLANILENVDEGFLVVDREYRIITANRAYGEMQKAVPDEILGRCCYEVSHQNNKPCYQSGEECAAARTFETGTPHAVLHTHHDKHGKPMEIEMKAFPIKDAAGKVSAVIETLIDVTEKRRLEEQLLQSQKMEAVGQLAGGLAHDFNNILSAIIGYGHMTLLKMPKGDPLRLNIGHILESADRAAALTQSLLAFGRKRITDRKPIDLNMILANVEKFLVRVIGEDIEVRLSLAEDALTVMADAGQLEQVFMNLATNARDAMPRGGSFTIGTALVEMDSQFVTTYGYGSPGTYAMVSATDSGVGMNEEIKQKIFEPFFTTKEVGKGTGLGLAMVYGIIRQHEGFINVYSEPDKGTTFRLYFPLIQSATAEEQKAVEVPYPKGGTETILLAEDDAQLRKLCVTILEQMGYTVIAAKDGEEAVTKFMEQKDRIRLLLFDIIMPKKNGKEAYDEIKKIKPSVPVVFVSGYAPEIIRQKALIDEGESIITKPVSPQVLLKKVREMLDT
jgi:PAS domain S-box-containing protein